MGITTRVDLSPAQLTELTDLIDCYLPHVSVWAFGSRVKGTARPHSDLDLVIFSRRTKTPRFRHSWDAREESGLLFRVDRLHPRQR
ncbi:nucleotidyltransferase domain-containing protein [Aeromonas jandaei]